MQNYKLKRYSHMFHRIT